MNPSYSFTVDGESKCTGIQLSLDEARKLLNSVSKIALFFDPKVKSLQTESQDIYDIWSELEELKKKEII